MTHRLPALLASLAAVAVLGPWLVGCTDKGTVTFVVSAPGAGGIGDPNLPLSPFQDARIDLVTLFDETSPFDEKANVALGPSINAHAPPGTPQSIGDVPIGDYNLLLTVTGGSELLGLARTPGISVLRGQLGTITMEVRKPLLFYQAQQVLAPATKDFPAPTGLMAFDTTLPKGALSDVPALNLAGYCPSADSCPGASAVTSDGLKVLTAIPGFLLVLDSGRLLSDGNLLAVATLPRSGAALPIPRAIELSPDGKLVAIATDQGVNIAPLSAILDGTVSTLPVAVVSNAVQLTWTPDSMTVVVLTGLTWNQVSCLTPQPANWLTIAVATPTEPSPPRAAPPSSTDLSFTPDGQLAFAVPCGGGLVHEGANIALVPGSNVARILVSGSRLVAAPGNLTVVNSQDPNGTAITQASVVVVPGVGQTPQTVVYDIPTLLVSFEGSTTNELLQPTDLLVYDLALSPDAQRLVMASRTRYEVQNQQLFGIKSGSTGMPIFFCDLTVVRDVYRLTALDLSSGTVTQIPLPGGTDGSQFGDNEVTPCSFTCTSCRPVTGGDCGGPTPSYACATTDGFIPGGLSLAFGSF